MGEEVIESHRRDDEFADNLVGFEPALLLAAVEPDHQSSGVGRVLKAAQRQRARDMGLDAVVWAFDPLQASNAA